MCFGSPVVYLALRVLHIVSMILWLGTGLGHPVITDIRRTVALGGVHRAPLIARLRTTTRVVVPAAVVTVVTGVALVLNRGGFATLPVRYHVAIGFALGVFVMGGAFTSRAMKALEASFTADDGDASLRAAGRIVLGLRIEDSLRLGALMLMLLPFERWGS